MIDVELFKGTLALTPDEREALVHGEVGELYRMGVNTFLLGYLVRFGLLGLTFDTYRARLRVAANLDDDTHSAERRTGS